MSKFTIIEVVAPSGGVQENVSRNWFPRRVPHAISFFGHTPFNWVSMWEVTGGTAHCELGFVGKSESASLPTRSDSREFDLLRRLYSLSSCFAHCQNDYECKYLFMLSGSDWSYVEWFTVPFNRGQLQIRLNCRQEVRLMQQAISRMTFDNKTHVADSEKSVFKPGTKAKAAKPMKLF